MGWSNQIGTEIGKQVPNVFRPKEVSITAV